MPPFALVETLAVGAALLVTLELDCANANLGKPEQVAMTSKKSVSLNGVFFAD